MIDPSPAIARQVQRLLEENGLRSPSQDQGQVEYFTTGDPGQMQDLLPRLNADAGCVQSLVWDRDRLGKL